VVEEQATGPNPPQKKENRTIDKMSFRVPTHFRMDVQKKLEENRPLSFEEISSVCRTLADAIEGHTHCPDGQALSLVIALVLDKHPHLSIDTTSPEGYNSKYLNFIFDLD
jgi:hypothetical protein